MKIPLFDIDGTLLKGGSSNQAHQDGFNYAFQTVFNLPTAKINDIVTDGKLDQQILLEGAVLHGVPEQIAKEKMNDAVSAVVSYFLNHLDQSKPEPAEGVVELLEILTAKSIPLGLLTGNIEHIAWKKLNQAGINDFFSFGAFGDLAYERVKLIDIAQTKLNNLGETEYHKTDLSIIGDSPLDIKCAQDGNIDVLAVATGNYSADVLTQYSPTLVVNSLTEREKILNFLQI